MLHPPHELHSKVSSYPLVSLDPRRSYCYQAVIKSELSLCVFPTAGMTRVSNSLLMSQSLRVELVLMRLALVPKTNPARCWSTRDLYVGNRRGKTQGWITQPKQWDIHLKIGIDNHLPTLICSQQSFKDKKRTGLPLSIPARRSW